MSAYQEARRRHSEAVINFHAAKADLDEAEKQFKAADAELEAANRELFRFAIDPDYRGPRRLERVPVPLGMPCLGAAMYLPVTETAEAAR